MKNLKGVEQDMYKWFKRRRYRIYLFVLLNILSLSASLLPYSNVLVKSEYLSFFVISFILILFNISSLFVLSVVIFLFLISFLYQISNQLEKADILANYIFGILFVFVIRYIFKPDDKTDKN